MTKKLKIFGIMIFIIHNTIGQNNPCNQFNSNENCEKGKLINTNPISPLNCERQDMINDFNWKINNLNNTAEYFVVPKSSNSNDYVQVWNPFLGPNDADYHQWITGGGSFNDIDPNDYQPKDGWELINANFGKYNPNQQGDGIYPNLPYFILYNKYTANFRFFGSLIQESSVYKTIEITLTIPIKTEDQFVNYHDNLNATNLLSLQGQTAQPLDQETDEIEQKIYVKYGNNQNVFFWFDIPVAYDACVCSFKSQLDLSFRFIQTADIELTGMLEGEMKTQSANTPQEHGKLVFNRVLSAAVATGVAVASGGTMINVKSYIDLIDVFKNSPNTHPNDKNNLEIAKNLLNCSNKFYDVVKKDYTNLNDTNYKKALSAASRILDGGVNYTSSLYNLCSETKSKSGSTLVTGSIKMQGTMTSTTEISNTIIQLGLPGSNWDITLPKFQTTTNNKVVPAYPTYNERLGTFALTETPKFEVSKNVFEQDFPLKDIEILTLNQTSDFKFTFNPLLKVNSEKTKIYARLVINEDFNIMNENFNFINGHCEINNVVFKCPFNFEKTQSSSFKFVSPFVEYEYLKNMFFRIDLEKNNSLSSLTNLDNLQKHVFVQFKILGVSENLDENNKPIEFYNVFTFPIKLEENTINQFNNNNEGNYKQGIKIYSKDLNFYDDENFYFEGPVIINSKLSTLYGKKVKIYSMYGFDIELGAEISPDIELIPGMHIPKVTQPEQNSVQVNNFCQSSNYKANVFSQDAIKRQKDEFVYNEKIRIESLKNLKFHSSIAPNPTTANFTVSIFNNNEQDYSIALMDVTGKVLLNNLYNGKQTSQLIETNGLAAGIYFVKITCGNTQKTEKLIIHNNQ